VSEEIRGRIDDLLRVEVDVPEDFSLEGDELIAPRGSKFILPTVEPRELVELIERRRRHPLGIKEQLIESSEMNNATMSVASSFKELSLILGVSNGYTVIQTDLERKLEDPTLEFQPFITFEKSGLYIAHNLYTDEETNYIKIMQKLRSCAFQNLTLQVRKKKMARAILYASADISHPDRIGITPGLSVKGLKTKPKEEILYVPFFNVPFEIRQYLAWRVSTSAGYAESKKVPATLRGHFIFNGFGEYQGCKLSKVLIDTSAYGGKMSSDRGAANGVIS